MPYVNIHERERFDRLIDELIENLRYDNPAVNGNVNYCISRIVAGAIRPKEGWNYTEASNAVKAFECAKLEFVRRILNNVENSAIVRNGDIEEYAELE